MGLIILKDIIFYKELEFYFFFIILINSLFIINIKKYISLNNINYLI